MLSTFLKQLFHPKVKNLLAVKQRIIYIYCLLIILTSSLVSINRIINKEYFLIAINGFNILLFLLVIFLARKKHLIAAASLLSFIILIPSFLVALNDASRIGDMSLYIAFVPIVNLFLIQNKRISWFIFFAASLMIAYLFGQAQLFYLPILTVFFVHMVYFFIFSIHVDSLEHELILENENKQALIDNLEVKNQEIEKLNQELASTNQTLQDKIEDIKQFAYLSSHNLQTPLHNIQLYSDLLKNKYATNLDELGMTSVNFLNKSSKDLSTTLHGLVDYFETFEKNQFEKLSVEKIIKEILSEEHMLIDQGKVAIQLEPLPNIIGNRIDMKKLFKITIQNALLHNQSIPNLKIEVKTMPIDDKIKFSIIDNGVGISKSDFLKIFKMHVSTINFSRGIGLALAKKIVNKHGGEIWVESELGKGTAMHFTIKNTSIDLS